MDNQNQKLAKSFEVAKNPSVPKRPSLLEKMQAKVRVVVEGNKDASKVETVKQDKVAEVMPVQVVEEDKYTIGGIDSNSNGIFICNKFRYYVISFYDRVINGNNVIIYDIGFIAGDNDIYIFYTGKEIIKSSGVPAISFGYMRHNNNGYINSYKTRFKTKNEDFFVLKFGVAWTGDFVAPNSVCTWRPSVGNVSLRWFV